MLGLGEVLTQVFSVVCVSSLLTYMKIEVHNALHFVSFTVLGIRLFRCLARSP